MSVIRNPKDFGAGLIYLSVGVAAVYIAQDYSMGSVVRMGPGYFPTVLGALLALVGLISLGRSLIRPGEGIGRIAWREAAIITVATVLFGLLLRGGGLVVSLLALTLVSAYASKYFSLKTSLLLAVGMTVFSVLVFIKGLGIPLPVWGRWFGG